ncbi:MAG: hypothetical protein U0N20_02800 [Clostridium sp.]
MNNIVVFILFTIPILMIGCGSLFLWKEKKDLELLSIILISLGLAIIAMYTLPNSSDDLQRHFDVMNSYNNHPLSVIFLSGYSYVILNNFIMYIIAQTGILSLYQGIFTFLGYFILLKLVISIYHDLEIKNRKILFIVLLFTFFMSFYKTYILAIRNYFCFIAGSYCWYLYSKNRIRIFTYVILVFLLALIHPVSLILLILLLFQKIKKKYIKNIFMLGIIFHYPILKLILNFLPQDLVIYAKINPYLSGTIQPYNLNFMFFYLLLALFAAIVIYKINKEKLASTMSLSVMLILAVSTFYQFDLIRRFMYIVPLFLIEPLFILLNNNMIFLKIKVKYLTACYMGLLSLAAILAIFANIRAYGWYWIF